MDCTLAEASFYALLEGQRHMEDGLVPSEAFLAGLRGYPQDCLPVELPLRAGEFLSRVGLPRQVYPFRDPVQRLTTAAICFSPEQTGLCSRGGRRFFAFGEIWDSRFLVDLTTEQVFYAHEETLLFVNSSLERFAVSMAYWLDFYPKFARRVNDAAARWPQGNVLNYLAAHPEQSRPGMARLASIDMRTMEELDSYWGVLCDLSRF